MSPFFVRAAAVASLFLLHGGGCDDNESRHEEGAPCTRSGDCEADLKCMAGVCRGPDDAATDSAIVDDAATVDAIVIFDGGSDE